MPKLLLLAFIISILLNACQTSSSFSTEDKQAVADEARQTLHSYYTEINKSGLLGELPYLDSSSDFFWVPPEYSTPVSYTEVATYIRQTAPLFQKIYNQWDSLRITPLTKELAAYTGTLHSTITDTTGITETHSLIETGLLIKRSDGWKLLNGQTAALKE